MATSPNPEQRSSSAILVQVRLDTGTTEFRLDRSFEIGRTEECAVCVKDPHVSRTHARVTFTNGAWWLQDLNSSNGVFLDGQKVSSLRIEGKAAIRLGALGPEVLFLIVPPESEADLPPVTEAAFRADGATALQPSNAFRTRSDAFQTRNDAFQTRNDATLPPKSEAFSRSKADLASTSKNEAPGKPAARIDYAARYFGKLDGQPPAGEHTMFIRSAFAQVQRKQKNRYGVVIAALVVAALGLAAFGYRQYQKASRQRQVAEQIFYSMKGLDLDIANLQELVSASNNQQGRAELKNIESRRAQMEDSYNHFLATLHIYDPKMTEEDRLILRVARIFGECELDMPKDFKSEVDRYIKNWQSSGRLAAAVRTANEKGYSATISKELMGEDLPPQFFYLALQESDFNPLISGPATHMGYAKGMWQFVPQTAVKYGLRVGPLVDEPQPDFQDDRDHADRETVAAGKYLKDLYGSDAEASGLLVMACYNWGESRVLPLVRSMPANPRERNFWTLLQKHRDQVPQETYDYVFSIVSAAVIGENPRLFGFNFDNPLAASGNLAQMPNIPPTQTPHGTEAHSRSEAKSSRHTARSRTDQSKAALIG